MHTSQTAQPESHVCSSVGNIEKVGSSPANDLSGCAIEILRAPTLMPAKHI
eukprot:m.1675127 g.1675127  ORF g.1675127 m.1675127 type:complete len:51 (-) comp183618_c0_seq1:38-190(-)